MIGWFIRGAMDFARTIEYAVQAGWSLIVYFIWLLPLTGLGTTESGIDCRALRTFVLSPATVLVASWFFVSIPSFGCTWVAGAAPCQPVVLPCTKAGHEAC